MATAVQGVHALRVYLEMIKFEHSIFALPFAMIGMMWAAGGRPGWTVFAWVIVAMVSARSAAMAFNRIADRDIDAANPRTRMRALPSGLLRLGQANLFFFASCAIFVLAAWMLNPLALALSPVALLVTLGYSLTKRFTPLSHLILGLGLGIAPAAAWIAVRGGQFDTLHLETVLPLVLAVMFWTAGFDVIYSLQDEEFDREHGLRSLPESIGKKRALTISRLFHLLSIACLAAAGFVIGAGPIYYTGVVFAAVVLTYEQSLVRADDLSRVNLAFFTLNGCVSVGMSLFALLDMAFA